MKAFRRSGQAVAVLLGMVVCHAASAGTITQTFLQPATNTSWEVADIAFNQFNAALGTLNSVTLSFGGTFTQTDTISAPDGTPPQALKSLTANANVLIFGAANFVNQIVDLKVTKDLVVDPGINIAPGASQTFIASGNFAYGPAAQPLSPYIGTGLVHFSLGGGSGVAKTGDLLATLASNTTSGGLLTLVYDYGNAPPVTVPEPGSLAMVGLALAGLAAGARRRKGLM